MKKRKTQLGVTLVEVSIGIALTSSIMAAGLWSKLQDLQLDRAAAQGQLMARLSGALGTYMTNNFGALTNGAPIAGVANPLQPTVAELVNLSLLEANFTSQNLFGSSYQNTVSLVPAGCTPPNCNVTGITFMTGPIQSVRGGAMVVDGGMLGTALKVAGGDGAVSSPSNPTVFSGLGGAWTAPNPTGLPGLLAMRTGYGSSTMSQFVRRDGALPFVASQSMGGNKLKAVGGIELTNNYSAGAGCSTNGALGADTNGVLMSCQNGMWQRAGEAQGSYAFFNATSCPEGWLIADGANGTVDLRGQFIRGWNNTPNGADAGRLLASQQANQSLPHEHGVSTFGDNNGAFLSNNPNNSFDTSNGNWAGAWNGAGGTFWWGTFGNPQSVQMAWKTTLDKAVTGIPGAPTETRPENVALLACMKS